MKKSSTSKSQSKTEIALKESEQRYRTTMMSVGDGVIATDTEGRVEMMNPVAEELTGWKQEEAQGKSLEDIFHIINEETRQTVENPVRRVMRECTVVGLANHSVLIAKGGTEHPIADSGAPIRNEKSNITGVVLVFRDQTNERIAQKSLQESERKFREIVKYLDEGYYSVTTDGLLLDHNQSFNRILGFDIAKDLKGIKLPDFWQNSDERKVYLQELMTRGFIRNYLINAKTISGEKVVVMANSHLVKDDQGRLVRIEGTYTDFTERKRAEERLYKLNRIYTVLCDINQAIVRTRVLKELFEKACSISVEQGGFAMAWIGLIDESSKKFKVIARAGKADDYLEKIDISFNGKPLSYCPIDNVLRQGQHKICNVIENKEMAPCQKIAYDLGFRSSASFPLKVSNILRGALTFYSDEPEFFDEEELKLLDEMASDISFAMEFTEMETSRRQAEETLVIQKSIADILLKILDDDVYHEVLQVILKVMHSPFGVFGYLDDAGALVVPSMTRHIWDKCQVAEKTFIFPKDTWGDSSWPRAIREKKSNHSNEISVKTPEGHITLTRHISLPILFQGEVIGLFQVANKETDYTNADINTLETIAGYIAPVLSARLQRQLREKEIRQLNVELEDRVAKRTTQLEASNKELETFAYSVSHDLRAPLRAVDGFSKFVLEDYENKLDSEGKRLLNLIRSNTQKMDLLITELLALSRVTRSELNLSSIDMTQMAISVFKESAALDVLDKTSLKVDPLPEGYADPTYIRQVWANLIANAIKFSSKEKKPLIKICGLTENGFNIYYVKDNGVGFNPEYTYKLFGAFQRLHKSDDFEGTGVGLAIIQRIIHRHGGKVWAEGEESKGATFYFSLPVKV